MFIAAQIFGQQDYKGRIVDSQSGVPIPYVNIGVFEKEIGTVSDEEGIFHLPLNNSRLLPSDNIIFSSLGYQTITIAVSEVELVYNEYPVIKMTPTNLQLEGVVVSDKANYMMPETVGYSNRGEEVYGYWKDNIALGGELGTKVVVRSGLRRLDNFVFEVWHNPSDSLLLRVNIYDDDGSLSRPKTNLNKSGQNILYTLGKNERMVSVDLKPYDVYVDNDFIISLELLKVYGDEEVGLVLAAVKDISKERMQLERQGWTTVSNDGHGSYRKYASQGKWERITDLNMAYTVESSLLVDEREFERFKRKKEKTIAKKRFVTGFAIVKGKMIAGVKIFNHRTKQSTLTDKRGRFSIAANKNDLISFTKKGYEPVRYKINTKPTLNVKLTPL
nr:carboxypeptidase-like regulatory domain-containing protein [Croceivirga thetidis]